MEPGTIASNGAMEATANPNFVFAEGWKTLQPKEHKIVC